MRTAKQIAAGQRRTLASMKARLVDMAAEWGDVDQYNMLSLQEIADKVQDASDNLTDEEA